MNRTMSMSHPHGAGRRYGYEETQKPESLSTDIPVGHLISPPGPKPTTAEGGKSSKSCPLMSPPAWPKALPYDQFGTALHPMSGPPRRTGDGPGAGQNGGIQYALQLLRYRTR